jgi:hypothetical protein
MKDYSHALDYELELMQEVHGKPTSAESSPRIWSEPGLNFKSHNTNGGYDA